VEQGLARKAAPARPAAAQAGMAGVVPMMPAELTVEAAMTGGQTIPAVVEMGPQARQSSSWTSRCAMRATNSRSATSSSTSPRKAAR
jgi:hypothetical protein